MLKFGFLQIFHTNVTHFIYRDNHSVKEPVSSLHRLSQQRRRTYSDTESYSDTPPEDSQSKFGREMVFFCIFL